MFIRPPQFYPLPAGTPAYNCLVYIGLPNTDPTIEANKLDITNGSGGSAVANPYTINAQGKPRNTNGEKITPYITENEYCIEFRSMNGALIDREPHMKSDALGASGGAGSSVVDAVINSFAAALISDLSSFDTIYIQSYAASWEGTATGPVGGFYAYRTGSLGAAGTGHPGAFYDSLGNQFKPANHQRLYAEMFGAVTGTGNDSFTAIKNMVATAILLEKPCFLDGDEYFINTQSNVAAGYSLMSYYAIKIDGNLAMYGNGNTIIKNTTANNNQYLFWVNNVDTLVIEGLTLDGNSTNATTGALYCAGVTKAVLNCTIKNSGPLYLSGSTTRQTDSVSGNLTISGAGSYAISGNGAGFKKLDLPDLLLTSCAKGIQVTNADVDAFGYSIPNAPIVNIGSITATITSELFNCVKGTVNFGMISGTVGTVFKLELGTADFDQIKGSSISVTCAKIIDFTTSSNGKLTRFDVDNVYARTTTSDVTYITITHATVQLVSYFHIGYIDISGVTGTTVGISLRDATGLGKIVIDRGIIACDTGILITTAGPKILALNLDLSGCTTTVTGATLSTWIGEPVAQTYAKDTTKTFAHNLGYRPVDIVFILKCTDAGGDAGYALNDTLEISSQVQDSGFSYGFSSYMDSTNIVIVIATAGLQVVHKTTRAGTLLTDSKWSIQPKAKLTYIYK